MGFINIILEDDNFSVIKVLFRKECVIFWVVDIIMLDVEVYFYFMRIVKIFYCFKKVNVVVDFKINIEYFCYFICIWNICFNFFFVDIISEIF